ncbi:MAG: plastocyanin/azurin family copper-binding protein [Balneolales bacterium]
MRYTTLFLSILCLFSETKALDLSNKTVNPGVDTTIVIIKGNTVNPRFEPAVVHVQPGNIIRFIVDEGLHTVTAYHPDNRRPLRIPKEAESFDSGPLQAGQFWHLKITHEGTYDYFCLPHESMGHVGRIIAGDKSIIPSYNDEHLSDIVKEKYLELSSQK